MILVTIYLFGHFPLQTLKASVHLFPQISKLLRLSRVQEVVFGLALTQSSSPEARFYASQFVKQKLPDLLRSYVDAGKG